MLILWLIVLPVELIQFVIRYELLPASLFSGMVRSFWILGFLIATTLLTSSSLLLRLVIVLFGLLIASPAYFVVGALLGTKVNFWRVLGWLFLIVKLGLGYYLLMTVLS